MFKYLRVVVLEPDLQTEGYCAQLPEEMYDTVITNFMTSGGICYETYENRILKDCTIFLGNRKIRVTVWSDVERPHLTKYKNLETYIQENVLEKRK